MTDRPEPVSEEAEWTIKAQAWVTKERADEQAAEAVAPWREALTLCVDAINRHASWCGYNRDASGDRVWWQALDAARQLLAQPDPSAGPR